MSEKNELKNRKCDKCKTELVRTAQGIKDHAATCKG